MGLNRFIKHSCAPEVVSYVFVSYRRWRRRRIPKASGDDNDVYVDGASSSSWAQACARFHWFATGQREKFTAPDGITSRKWSPAEVEWNGRRRSQTLPGQTFYSFVRYLGAAVKRLVSGDKYTIIHSLQFATLLFARATARTRLSSGDIPDRIG